MASIHHPTRTASAIDVLRLDILMQHYRRLGCGTAALRWTDPLAAGPLIRAHLVALLYGHMLAIHPASRDELFARVGELARQNVRSGGTTGFEFAPWMLPSDVSGAAESVWPWLIVPADQLSTPTICSAILKLGEPSTTAPAGRWLQLEMAAGPARLLVPSAALIAIAGLSQASNHETRYLLARLLWQMNRFWGTPHQVPFFSEAVAYAAADAAIRSPPFRIP